jgi:nitroreductase
MPERNAAAFDFLAQRRSFPAKLMAGAVPSEAELRQILTVALRVPDHGKLEPWRLMVLERPALARLADLAEARGREIGADAEKIGKGRGQFDLGQLAVAVISSPKGVEKVPLAEQRNSAAALAFGIVIAATAAGWRANWLTGWVSHDRAFITRAFGCTAEETVVGLVHIGSAGVAEAPDRPRPELDRIATWVRA